MDQPLIEVEISHSPIAPFPAAPEGCGAIVEFAGVVRGQENGQDISALEYQAYEPMARLEIERLIRELLALHPCRSVRVRHRIGIIPVGETAILLQVTALHRREAFALASDFMDRLKTDVPIWKVRSIA